MHHTTLASLFLGAGVGLVAAHPAPWGKMFAEPPFPHPEPKPFPGKPTSTGASSGFSTAPASTGGFSSYSVPEGSGVSPPTVKGYVAASGSGVAAPTGTGSYSYSSSAIVSVAASSAVVSTTAVSAASNSTSSSGAAGGEVSNATASDSCTFTDVDSAVSGKADCTDIILSGIEVPAGTTLDMTDLTDGTTVTFEGTTTFGYEEWDGPLISFSGTDITIQGADGHLINMGGEQWWDGEGSNGGVTKPKGFYAHDLTDSVITGLSIKNTPIQCFSVNGASNLQIVDVTIDDSEVSAPIDFSVGKADHYAG